MDGFPTPATRQFLWGGKTDWPGYPRELNPNAHMIYKDADTTERDGDSVVRGHGGFLWPRNSA